MLWKLILFLWIITRFMLRILNSFLWIIICQAKCEDLPLEGSENDTESKNATFAEENNDDLAVFEDYKSDEKPEFTSAKHVLLGHLTNI